MEVLMAMNEPQVHKIEIDKLSIEEKQEAAMAFSEGNPILRDCLLLLWEHKITTIGCCNGHEYPHDHFSIAMEVDEFSQKLIKKFCNYVQNINSDSIECDFGSSEYHDFDFTIRSPKNLRDDILNFIIKSIDADKLVIAEDYNYDSDYYIYGMLLQKYAIQNNSDLRYGILNDNDMMFTIGPRNVIFSFEPDSPNLDDCLQEISTTCRFSSGPYKCTNESLKKFLKLIYPNLESYYMNNHQNSLNDSIQNNNFITPEQIAQFNALNLCDEEGCLSRANSKVIMGLRGQQLPPGRVLMIYELNTSEIKILNIIVNTSSNSNHL